MQSTTTTTATTMAAAKASTPSTNYAPSNLIAHDEENNRLISHKTKSNNDVIDDIAKPLSKNEIVKRFDNKFKNDTSAAATPTIVKATSTDNNKCIEEFDDLLVTDNIDEIDDNTNIDDDARIDDQLTPIDLYSNVASEKIGHENGGSNGNSGHAPPKPMPRTSRNNSVSSDQGFVMIVDEIQSRPVAKPRNITTTGYKVHLTIHLTHTISICLIHQQIFILQIEYIYCSRTLDRCTVVIGLHTVHL